MMTYSTEVAIKMALRARLETLNLSPALPNAWPDEKFTTPDGPYLAVQYMPNTTDRNFLDGSDPHYFKGIFQITVRERIGLPYGDEKATEVAGQIVAHFPADQRMPYQDIIVRVSKRPDIAQGMRSGTRWEVPISIPYHLEA